MVHGTPKWGQRAYACMTEYNMSAIVYFKDKVGTMDDVLDDWRLELIHELNREMQKDRKEEEEESIFLPLVWTWEHDQKPNQPFFPLRDFIKVE